MTHYDTLGISKNATEKEIKEAYKKLIKKYHPDVYPGDKSFAEKKTQEINHAYDILSNEEAKRNYDIEISPSYDYTPPKYTNPESYSYKNYYSENSSSDFENYKRYADYHRSKVPNSNYNVHDEFSDNIVNSVNKMSSNKKTILILTILFLYILFLVITFFKINSLLNGNSSGTLLNTHVETLEPNITVPSTENDLYDEDDETLYEDFDLNDYISEDELKQIYDTYYHKYFDSFEEFKDTLTDYLYFNYDF